MTDLQVAGELDISTILDGTNALEREEPTTPQREELDFESLRGWKALKRSGFDVSRASKVTVNTLELLQNSGQTSEDQLERIQPLLQACMWQENLAQKAVETTLTLFREAHGNDEVQRSLFGIINTGIHSPYAADHCVEGFTIVAETGAEAVQRDVVASIRKLMGFGSAKSPQEAQTSESRDKYEIGVFALERVFEASGELCHVTQTELADMVADNYKFFLTSRSDDVYFPSVFKASKFHDFYLRTVQEEEPDYRAQDINTDEEERSKFEIYSAIALVSLKFMSPEKAAQANRVLHETLSSGGGPNIDLLSEDSRFDGILANICLEVSGIFTNDFSGFSSRGLTRKLLGDDYAVFQRALAIIPIERAVLALESIDELKHTNHPQPYVYLSHCIDCIKRAKAEIGDPAQLTQSVNRIVVTAASYMQGLRWGYHNEQLSEVNSLCQGIEGLSQKATSTAKLMRMFERGDGERDSDESGPFKLPPVRSKPASTELSGEEISLFIEIAELAISEAFEVDADYATNIALAARGVHSRFSADDDWAGACDAICSKTARVLAKTDLLEADIEQLKNLKGELTFFMRGLEEDERKITGWKLLTEQFRRISTVMEGQPRKDPRDTNDSKSVVSIDRNRLDELDTILVDALSGGDTSTLSNLGLVTELEVIWRSFKPEREGLTAAQRIQTVKMFQDCFPKLSSYLQSLGLPLLLNEQRYNDGKEVPVGIFSAWNFGNESRNLCWGISEQLSAIAELESLRPGSTRELYERFGILNFGRYDPNRLLNQINAIGTDINPKDVVHLFFSREDNNGAFNRSLSIETLSEQHDGVMVVYEYPSAESLARRMLRAGRDFGSLRNIGVIGHGSPGQFGSYILNKPVTKEHIWSIECSSVLNSVADDEIHVFFRSCSSGDSNEIIDTVAQKLRGRNFTLVGGIGVHATTQITLDDEQGFLFETDTDVLRYSGNRDGSLERNGKAI